MRKGSGEGGLSFRRRSRAVAAAHFGAARRTTFGRARNSNARENRPRVRAGPPTGATTGERAEGPASEVASSAELGGTSTHCPRRSVARRLRRKEAERLVAHEHHLWSDGVTAA